MPARPETLRAGPADLAAAAKAAPRSKRWGDLGLRTLSAAVLGSIGLLCLWRGGAAWNGLLAVAALGLLAETWRLCQRLPAPAGRATAVAACTAILLAGAALAWLRAAPATGLGNVLLVVLVVWATDIAGYVVGRCAGGPLLAAAVSPGKTWAGAVGGLLAAAAVAMAVAAVATGAPAARPVLLALLLSLAAQAGDLAESAAKRAAAVKDSGRLIPGHGGLLDRLDGMLAASLVAGLLAVLAGRGVDFLR